MKLLEHRVGQRYYSIFLKTYRQKSTIIYKFTLHVTPRSYTTENEKGKTISLHLKKMLAVLKNMADTKIYPFSCLHVADFNCLFE